MINWANRLTVIRIVAAPLFIASLVYYSPERGYFYRLSIAVFLLACLTDGLDGYIARRFNQKTVLGSYIDPIADKLLLMSGFLCLSFISYLPESMKIPAWATILVIARDGIILIGSTMIFLTTGHLKAEPLYIGKLTTVFQMIALFFALISAPETLKFLTFVAMGILTVVSGIQYIRMGGKLLQAS